MNSGRSLSPIVFRLIFLALIVVMAASCSSVTRQRGAPLEDQPTIAATSPMAQSRFDEALRELDAGRYEEAADRLRLIQAEFPDDAIAVLAELYVGRAAMGTIAWVRPGGEAYSGQDEALRLFAALMRDEVIDTRVRYGAKVYYALELAMRGQTEESLLSLRDYPGPNLSPIVLKGDRVHVLPLLTESLYRAGRGSDALEAIGKLHDLLALPFAMDEVSPADEGEGVNGVSAEAESLLSYVRGRSFEIAETMLKLPELHELLSSPSPLLRAASAWAIIQKALVGAPQDKEREAMVEIFNAAASDFIRTDAAERAAELSLRLTAIGGPRRLILGALVPLSGPNRAVGRRALAGMLIAQSAFHHSGAGEVTLVFQDSRDVEAGFAALKAQGVSAIIGPLDGPQSRQAALLATKHNIPVISLAAEPVSRGEGAENVALFRNFIQATVEAQAMAQLAFDELGDRRAAVLYPDIGYGRAMAETFASTFRSLGGQVVIESPYDRTSSDFAQSARRVAAAKPDAIFIPDTAAKVAEITAFLAQENVWGHGPEQRPSPQAQRTFVHYLGTSLWQDPILLRQAASYVGGALVPAWFSPAYGDPLTRDFTRRFQAVYDRSPQDFEAFAHDSVVILRYLMIERGLQRPGAIRDALLEGLALEGTTGRFSFDKNGEPVRKLRFLKVQGNEWAVFERTYQTGDPEVLQHPAALPAALPVQP